MTENTGSTTVAGQEQAEDDGWGTGKKAGLTVLNTLLDKVKAMLQKRGMPTELHIIVLDHAPSDETLAILGNPVVSRGRAIISAKNGQVMYNFGGKPIVRANETRLQGNVFLGEDYIVSPAMHKAYVEAKKAKALATEANKGKLRGAGTEDDAMDAGESTD